MQQWMMAAAALAVAGCGGALDDGKKATAAQLKDPSSAQFRNVQQGGGLVCGEVNGKNSYGAYSGFKMFVYDGLSAQIEPENGRLGAPSADEIYAVEARTNFLRKYNDCRAAS